MNRGIIDQAGGRDFRFVDRLVLGQEASRVWRIFVARQLDRVGDGQPAALVPGTEPLMNSSRERIGADDLKVLLVRLRAPM